jgi:hypothetical protein
MQRTTAALAKSLVSIISAVDSFSELLAVHVHDGYRSVGVLTCSMPSFVFILSCMSPQRHEAQQKCIGKYTRSQENRNSECELAIAPHYHCHWGHCRKSHLTRAHITVAATCCGGVDRQQAGFTHVSYNEGCSGGGGGVLLYCW